MNRGFVIPFTSTAIHLASVLFKFLALLFGIKPVWSITSKIFFFVSGLIDVALELEKEKRLRGIVFLGGKFEHSEEKIKKILPHLNTIIPGNRDILRNPFPRLDNCPAGAYRQRGFRSDS